MKLYSYWRSTTSFRVRAALNLKGLSYDIEPVDLVAGDQRDPSYTVLNPGQGVPTLVLDDGTVLTQSMAILDYLDEVYGGVRLTPGEPLERAKVLAAAHAVALDIHPVNNLRVIGQLKSRFGADADACTDWMCHWMAAGFAAVESMISKDTTFAFGEKPGIADLCITAQVYNAHRWGLDMSPFPMLTRIETNCLDVPEINAAHPDNQPDAKVPA